MKRDICLGLFLLSILFFSPSLGHSQDFDGDGVDDIADIDDDNDGVPDAIESPECFYTEVEIRTLSNASTTIPTYNTTSWGIANIIDRNPLRAVQYRLVASIVDQEVFKVEFVEPVVLERLQLEMGAYGLSNTSGAYRNTTMLQGSNDGTNWQDLESTATAKTVRNGIQSIANTEQSGVAFKYYRLLGISGRPYYGRIEEITADIVAIPSLFPKGTCSADEDNDGRPNHQDLDSDGDGCADSVEWGAEDFSNNDIVNFNTGTDANDNGLLDLFESGSSGLHNYDIVEGYALDDDRHGCTDTDDDDIADMVDLDDDNDGVLDTMETSCTSLKSIRTSTLTWHGFAANNVIMVPSGGDVNKADVTITGGPWANAYSDREFSIPFRVEGTISAASNGMIGILPVDGTETNGWNDGGYKIQFNNVNGHYVRHGNIVPGWQGPSGVGQTFALEINEEGIMSYWKNGSKIFAGVVPKTNYKIVLTRGSFSLSGFEVSEGISLCDDLDTDNDNVPNRIDLDSDGDGCSDGVEAGSTAIGNNDVSNYPSGADTNKNGLLDVYESGTSGVLDYEPDYEMALDDARKACVDTDGDSINDIVDIDDDNDGILDEVETNCLETSDTLLDTLSWHGTAVAGMTTSPGRISMVTPTWRSAYSDQTFQLPLAIEGTINTARHGMIGINPVSGNEVTGWNDGSFKFQFNGSNGMYVRHGTARSGWHGPSIVGTTFKLVINSAGQMAYYHNGRIVYIGQVPVEAYRIVLTSINFEAVDLVIKERPRSCATVDTDGDDTANHLDLDSDGDGCSDSVEWGAVDASDNDTSNYRTGTDANENGLLDEFESGTSGTIEYDLVYGYALDGDRNGCIDTDNDDIANMVDIDDDNDGVLDTTESECTELQGINTHAMTWHGFARNNVFSFPTEGHGLAADIMVNGGPWANAYSDIELSLPLSLEGTIPYATNGMIGILPVDRAETNGWNDGGYKIQFNSTHGVYVRHASVTPGWQGPSVVGQTFKLEVDEHGNMTYWKDGSVIFSGIVPQTQYKVVLTRGTFAISGFQVSQGYGVCEELDTDSDNTPNSLDLDSDADGCDDGVETGSTDSEDNDITNFNSGPDTNNNGLLDQFEEGTSGTVNYIPNYGLAIENKVSGCLDTDGDGIGDVVDLDDDNDGVLDALESETTYVETESTSNWSLSSGFTSRGFYNYNCCGVWPTEGSNYLHFNSRATQHSGTAYVSLGTLEKAGTYIIEIDILNFNNLPFPGTLTEHGFRSDGSSGDAPGDIVAEQLVTAPIPERGETVKWRYTWIVPESDPRIGKEFGYSMTVLYDRVNANMAIDNLILTSPMDTDGDGIMNHLDLDSDGDGCSDSVESGGRNASQNNIEDYNSGTDANQNGFLDEFEGDNATHNYRVTYDYALKEELNQCTDTDGDGIGDLVDIDDDNDGILDYEESPSCFYSTDNLIAEISTDVFAQTSNPLENAIDGNARTFTYFRPNVGSAGMAIFTVTPRAPMALSAIHYLARSWPINHGSDRSKLQGYNGAEWVDLSPELFLSGASRTQVIQNTLDVNGIYDRFRLVITAGSVHYGGISEIKLIPSSLDIRFGLKENCTEDTDGDGIANHLDLDSDGDGCSDSVEAGALGINENNTSGFRNGNDANNNGLLDEFEEGSTGTLNYTPNYYLAISSDVSACEDTDKDGIGDLVDIDDDNDGVLDATEGCEDGTLERPFTHLNRAYLVPNGRYYFDFGTGIFEADIDNSEGGGWVLILQYVHRGGTNPSLEIIQPGENFPKTSDGTLGADEAGSEFWGHTGNLAFSQFADADELRFYGESAANERITHFRTSVGLEYARSGSGSFDEIADNYVPLPGHTSFLPRGASYFYYNRGNEALTRFPFWYWGTWHWGIRGNGNRWEVDDFPGNSTRNTIHRVWVRSNTSPSGFCSLDTDGDGKNNSIDLDSDGDGCSDSVEAGALSIGENDTSNFLRGDDLNKNGLLDRFEEGTTGQLNYEQDYSLAVREGISQCLDTDGDGISDLVDIDDDNDGVTDDEEIAACDGTEIDPENILTHSFSVSSDTGWDVSSTSVAPTFNAYGAYALADADWDVTLKTTFETEPYDVLEIGLDVGKYASSTSDRIVVYVDGQEMVSLPATEITGTHSNQQRVVFRATVLGVESELRIVMVHRHVGGNNDFSVNNVTVDKVGEAVCDTDGDGTPNHLDLDSDDDGCADDVEANRVPKEENDLQNYNSGTDANNNGYIDSFENEDIGHVISYMRYAIDDSLSACSEECITELEAVMCGDFVEINAGEDYETYQWVKDTNGNNRVDASDEEMTPGSNAHVLRVNEIGTYIVSKRRPNLNNNEDLCLYQTDIIKVVRYGDTQSNPIEAWFNARNSDADATNDVKGELVNCSIDGSTLQKIFLCGDNDSYEIDLSITDVEKIAWEKLDDDSCEAAQTDCANKNIGCTWNQVHEGATFTLDSEGSYKLVLNYFNGCTSKFYFDVFQNNLDLTYRTKDLYCDEKGNITITNPQTNYGFRLENAETNETLIGYAAANGPNFDIDEAGTYIVYTVQLDQDGTPIEGACEFSTPEIEIKDNDIEIEVTAGDKICSSNGSVEIKVLNVRANYYYELYQDAGNGTLGTLVDDQRAEQSDGHTFANVNPGDYVVLVRTDDKCEITDTITVREIVDPTVSATVKAHIGCVDGVVELSPEGGFVDPDYRFAIWSKNGTDLYTTIGDIPSSAYQTERTFDFESGEEGKYVFVVVDSNDCHALSNEIDIKDNGVLTMQDPTVDEAILCNGMTNGKLTINISNGTAPIKYSIDGVRDWQTSPTFDGLAAGTYTLRAIDDQDCQAEMDFVLSEPDALEAKAEVVTGSCNDQGGFTIELNDVQGGTAPYEYSHNGTDYASGSDANSFDLNPGSYTLSVKDANGCTFTIPVEIGRSPEAPEISEEITYSCDGKGVLTVGASESDYGYTYALNGTDNTPETNNVFTGIDPGNHTLTVNYTFPINVTIDGVSNAETCTETIEKPIVIAEGKEFKASITASGTPSCSGSSDGSITFKVENFDGTSGYEYSTDNGVTWVGTTLDETTLENLSAGTYTIKLKVGDCELSLEKTLEEPSSVVVAARVTAQATCEIGGVIEASAQGGTPGFVYQLEDTSGNVVPGYDYATNGENTTFSNLAHGSYMVKVRDKNGCEDSLDTAIAIDEPEAIDFTATPTACYSGQSNGTIAITVNNGNGGYLFRINEGTWIEPSPATAVTHTFEGLSSGTYLVEVKDELGCLGAEQTVVIDAQLKATFDIDHVTACADGKITVQAEGGDGAYRYAFVSAGTTVTDSDFGTANEFTITSGNEGDFDVYVRDNEASAPYCEFTQTVTINAASTFDVQTSTEDPKCFGEKGTLSVTVTGDAPYTIELIDEATSSVVETKENIMASTSTFYNVDAGTYTVKVTEANGCEESETGLTLTEPVELTAEVEPIYPADCQASSPAGLKFVGYPTTIGTVQFSVDGGDTWEGTNPEITGYTSGTVLTPAIRTVDGSNNTICEKVFDDFVVPYPLDDLDITISAVVVNCDELQVKVQGTAGQPPYKYTYTNDPENFDPSNPENPWTTATPGDHTFTGLVPGRTYKFYVEDSATPANCMRESSVNVNDIDGYENPVEISEEHTPACNGANNGTITFTLDAGTSSPSMSWELFDLDDTSVQSSGGQVTWSNTITVENLSPNEQYYIVVTQVDGSGTETCVSASENVKIKEQDAITANLENVADITCAAPGLVRIKDIDGGGGTFTYTLTSTDFTASIETSDNPVAVPLANLTDPTTTGITVSVSVTDQYGCTASLGTVDLDVAQNPEITHVSIDNCQVPTSATVVVSGGSGTYRYSIDNGESYQNSNVFENLATGTYTIQVIDGNGCTDTENIEVYSILEASANVSKLLDCSTSPNAEITISVSNGSGTYAYQVDGPGTTDQARTNFGGTDEVVWTGASVEGTYHITVFDADTASPECERSFQVEVAATVSPEFDFEKNNVTCNGGNNGSILLTWTSSGITPLSYTIDPQPAGVVFDTASSSFVNLPAGTYEITGTGTNECTTVIADIEITEPDTIAVPTPADADFTCTSGNEKVNPELVVDTSGITGGSGNYVRFEFIKDNISVQDGSSATLVVTEVEGGTYTIHVYDDKGCMGSTSKTVAPFDELQEPTLEVDEQISCVNAGESITITAHGSLSDSTDATHNYEFTLVGTTTTNTTGAFVNLGIGVHVFEVTNTVTGCTTTISHTVEDPVQFDIDVVKLRDSQCFETETGAITIGLLNTAYDGGFEWEIFDVNGTLQDSSDDTSYKQGTHNSIEATSEILLRQGTYRVVATQSGFPNCPQETTVTIAGPSAELAVSVEEIAGVLCADEGGKILVEPSGGAAPYTITISDGTNSFTEEFAQSYLFEELPSGTYSVSVTDSLGCVNEDASITLVKPDPIVASVSPDMVLDCPDDVNGVVTATIVSGGTGTILYQLNRYDISGTSIQSSSVKQAGNTFTDLAPGTYSISIFDDRECGTETETVTITVPSPELKADLIKVSPLDCGVDAVLELQVSGGAAPYQWSENMESGYTALSAGDTHRFNVGEGTYHYYVKDANDCVAILSNSITIEEIPPLDMTLDTSDATIRCNGSADASLLVQGSGGLGDYQYALYADATLSTQIAGPNTDGIFENLPAGSYYVSVTSSRCNKVSQEIVIDEPPALEVASEQTNVTCTGENDGTITVSMTGGAGGYQFAISPNLDEFGDEGTFTDLEPGTYTVIAQDVNGCFETLDFEITEPEPLQVEGTSTPETCLGDNDGTISLTFEGGTPPYSVALNSNDSADFVEGIEVLENLPAGDHVIVVRDANGCETNTVVQVAQGINLNATVTPVYECSGEATPHNSLDIIFEDETAREQAMYALDSTDPNDMQLSADFTDIAPGAHYLAIASVESGCVVTYDFEIANFETLELELTQQRFNVITASGIGGDGEYRYEAEGAHAINDNEFSINETGTYTVTVTDGNGCTATEEIFMEFIDVEIPNFFTPDGDGFNDTWKPRNLDAYPNAFIKIYDRYGREVYQISADSTPWDGSYSEVDLPSGDYWYIMKLNGENDKREFVGHFNLSRSQQ